MSEITKDQGRRIYNPKVDICEKEEEIILTAEMPGVGQGDVDLTLEGDILTLYGHTQDDNFEGYIKTYSEYGAGDYKGVFKLTEIVDRTQIGASLKNGILTITLRKVEAAKPRKIEVKLAA
jgi:HSP20 family molecular chaperone IbpA